MANGNALKYYWPFIVALFAMGVGWGSNTMRVATAEEEVELVAEEVEDVKKDIEEINTALTRIDTNQMHISNDIEEIKQLLRAVAESVDEAHED